MKPSPAFHVLDVPPVAADRARFEIIPAPLEKSVSYGRGTADGPAALLGASAHLEAYDGGRVPAEAGIYTGPAVDCTPDAASVLAAIAGRVTAALKGGRVPIVLGGEHTVTVGAVEALSAFCGSAAPSARFGVVQFDAHADLRDRYEDNDLSHGCVMRRIVERGIPVFQVGVRSLSAAEAAFRLAAGIPHADAEDLAAAGRPSVALPPDFPRRIYLTFDLDAFDPAVMPGTGTPEPGGLFWYDALRLIQDVLDGRELVGFDVVELAPFAGSQVSEFTAAKLVYVLMAAALKAGPP